ncbi:MAG: CoA transferase [Acidobacteriota bacterium]|nr:CoA transferase [Acidobacteriota bacterium]
MATDANRAFLLADVRAVDLTDDYGSMAGRVLADLGGEVVRVEPPDGGRGRLRGPFGPGGSSLHHAFRNGGKLIVSADPDRPADRGTVDGLLAGADLALVAGGWAAGVAGWSAAELAERHPHLVVVSVTPFGLAGPAAGWSASELVAQCLAGVVYRSGAPELPPVSAPGGYCEDVGAIVALLAGLIALHRAGHDGRGELVDVSAVLALAGCTDMALPLWSQNRADQARWGAGLYPLFPCRDGLARIVLPMSPADWRSLIAWMGSPPEWTGPDWQQPMLGPEQRELVMARLPSMFASRTRAEVAADADLAGVRVTAVLTPAEVLDNEHVAARRTFTEVDLAGSRCRLQSGLFSVDGRRVDFRPAEPGDPPSWPARPGPRPAAGGGALPLEGLRILEIGSGVAVPEAARILGEWGAEVIKVEHPRRPDFQRMVMGGEMNPAFATVARGKLGFGVDLGDEEGRRLVRQLLPSVDVILENNATGVIERLGLGWDVVHAAHPAAIMVSTQLYGNRGPWAARKGYGPSARAAGGLTWLWSHGPDAPRGVMSIHPDHLAGRLVALAALAAVRARRLTGTGCHIDLAQFEAVSFLLGDLLAAESLDPGTLQPTGNRNEEHAPWGLYRCADDQGSETWLALTVTGDDAWRALLGVAGGAVPDRPAWRSTAGRLEHRDEIDRLLASWLRHQDSGKIEGHLQAAGVAAGRAVHPRLEIDHPVFAGRGYPTGLEQPGCGPLIVEGPAFTGTRMGSPRRGPAPAIGEHTAPICASLLGMDAASLSELVSAGVLVTHGEER